MPEPNKNSKQKFLKSLSYNINNKVVGDGLVQIKDRLKLEWLKDNLEIQNKIWISFTCWENRLDIILWISLN